MARNREYLDRGDKKSHDISKWSGGPSWKKRRDEPPRSTILVYKLKGEPNPADGREKRSWFQNHGNQDRG